MSLEQITQVIKDKVGNDCGLNASVKFLLDDAQVILVDAKVVPNVVSNDNADADCTVKITSENIQKILDGGLNPMTAFMMGKIKVEGNMGVAMNINKIFN
jgi:putative sterol carrier protein